MTKHILLITSALGSLAFSAGTAAAATAAPTTSVSADQGATIGELVVTAEKREENLQDVPVAISAFTSQQRDLIGIESIQDIAAFTPGLVYSNVLDRASIRGVGRLSNNLASDAAVAVYSDNFFTTSTVEAGKPPLFVDRTEVLRGPQGTLYGRNSIGGAINVISRRPTKDMYAEVRATVANYGYVDVEGAMSGPLSDHVRFRLAGYDTNQYHGYFNNVAGGPSEGGVVHGWYVEPQIEADIGDHAEIWAKFAVSGVHNARGGAGDLRNAYGTGHFDYSLNSPIAASLFFDPAYGLQATDPIYGAPITHTQAGTTTDNPAITNNRLFNTNRPETINLTGTYIFDVQFTYHFPTFDLKYTGGYDAYKYHLQTDFDGTPITSYQIPLKPFSTCSFVPGCKPLTVFPDLQFDYKEDNHWTSHEITLSSTTDSPVQWVVGAFYYDEGYHNPQNIYAPNQPGVLTPKALSAANPAGNAPNPSGSIFYFDYKMKTQSVAGYAQIDWKVSDTFKVTGGIRYTHDHKEGQEFFRAICFNTGCIGDPANFGTLIGSQALDITPVLANAGTPKGVVAPGVYDTTTGIDTRGLKDSWQAVTGTAGVEWNPDSDTNLYLRYSRGYKSGGFNAGVISSGPETDSEHINAYEIGLKRDFGHVLRTNFAVYYYDYQSLQIPIGVNVGGVITTQFANIPKVRSYGFEFEGEWAPIDHAQIIATYSYNNSSVRSSCVNVGGVATGTCFIDAQDPTGADPANQNVGSQVGGQQLQGIQGNTLPQAPRHKFTINANYTWVMDAGSLTLSGTFEIRSKTYGAIFQRSYNVAPSWNQTDFRLAWRAANDKYEVIGFLRNAFNQDGYPAGATGVRIANQTPTDLTQPVAVGGSAEGVPTTFTRAGVLSLNPPRTYGVEFHYKFF